MGAQNGTMPPNVGPTFGNMSPTYRPTQHLGPKIADTDIRQTQLRYYRTNSPHMVILSATSAHKRRSRITQGSLLAAIELIIQATSQHQLQTSPLSNCSSTPPSACPAPSSSGWTWQISISTFPCPIQSTCTSDWTSSLKRLLSHTT